MVKPRLASRPLGGLLNQLGGKDTDCIFYNRYLGHSKDKSVDLQEKIDTGADYVVTQ
jgi:hypothetical protein